MILKIPCKVGNDIKTALIRRDAINLVLPLEDGAKCHIYVDNIATPLEAHVRANTLTSFLGRAYPEGAMKVPDEKEEQDSLKIDVTKIDFNKRVVTTQ